MALEEGGGPAPYAPPSAIIGIVEAFRNRGLQTPFTVDVLTRAGVTEALAPRTLRAMQQIDLISEDGNPSTELQELRTAPSDQFRERFAAVIRAAYAPIFAFADPATDTSDRVRDAFRVYRPVGQQGRMVTLFVGLCEYAGIIEASARRSAAADGRPARPASRARAQQPAHRQRRDREAAAAAAAEQTAVRSGGKVPAAIAAFLGELPDPRAGWSREQRDKFLTTFTVLVDYAIPIRESGSTNDTGDVDE